MTDENASAEANAPSQQSSTLSDANKASEPAPVFAEKAKVDSSFEWGESILRPGKFRSELEMFDKEMVNTWGLPSCQTSEKVVFPLIYLPEGVGTSALEYQLSRGEQAGSHAHLVSALHHLREDLVGSTNMKHVGVMIVITSHYTSANTQSQICITSAHNQKLESCTSHGAQYTIPEALKTWRPRGDPESALKIATTLRKAGYEVSLSPTRGLDHACYVPMRIMFPKPPNIIQISINENCDSKFHVELGEKLAWLRAEIRNSLWFFVGSEYSNPIGLGLQEPTKMQKLTARPKKWSINFHKTLMIALTTGDDNETANKARSAKIGQWAAMKNASDCHPSENKHYMMPVCVGTGVALGTPGKLYWEGPVGGEVMQSIICWK